MKALRITCLMLLVSAICVGGVRAQDRTYWSDSELKAERALRRTISTQTEQQRQVLETELSKLSKTYERAATRASAQADTLRRRGRDDEADATAMKAYELDRRADASANVLAVMQNPTTELLDPRPAYEAVVNALNPMLPICKGDVSFRGRFTGWQRAISEFFTAHPRYSDSVARLEVSAKSWVGSGVNSAERFSAYSPGGTAFSISPRLVVTAWHVLEQRGAAEMKPDGSAALKPESKWRANFGGEYACSGQGGGEVAHPVIDIEAIVKVDTANDIAILRLAADFTDGSPLPIETSPKLVVDDKVAVMGFPGRDLMHYDIDVLKELLRVDVAGNYKFDIKRFQPGLVRDCSAPNDGLFGHDATTLGNNSGSPVFSLTTGKVVGVHSRGLDSICNYAESSAALVQALAGVPDAPVIQTASNP